MKRILSEKELEKMLEKIEFKRSYPELVTKMINEIQNKTSLIYEAIRNINIKISRRIERTISNHILKLKQIETDFTDPIAGVDGSLVIGRGIGKRFFALISVSQVIFKKGTLDLDDPKINLSVNMETIEEKYDMSPRYQAVIKMMIGESKAINALVNNLQKGFIFLDGPIIDPPNLSYTNYVNFRAEAVCNAIKNDINIIGFVKRYKSNLIKDKIFPDNVINASDQEIIPILFSILRRNYTFNNNDILATKPYPITPDSEYVYSRNVLDLYDTYFKKHGIEERIFASYIQVKEGVRPIKIEFFASNEEEAINKLEKLSNLINEISVAGTNLPLPVLLAHKTSLIRKKVAGVLFREVLSRLISFSSGEFDFESLKDMIYVMEED